MELKVNDGTRESRAKVGMMMGHLTELGCYGLSDGEMGELMIRTQRRSEVGAKCQARALPYG